MKKNIFLTLALIISLPLLATPALAVNTYSAQQVSWHNNSSDCWTIINNRVYNLTGYISSHPGGQAAVLSLCGINGSNLFNAKHLGSATVNSILMNYYLGDLASDSNSPSIPTNLSVNVISSSQINLSWSVSTDNIGVTGYKVYRNNTLIGTVSSNSFSDTGLNSGTFYTYNVSAFDTNGNISDLSYSISATTSNYNSTLPSAPNGLTVYLNSNRAILHWNSSFDTAGIKSYKIVRNGTIIGESSDNNYIDSSVINNSTYNYYVIAVSNNSNLSTNSNSASLSMPKNVVVKPRNCKDSENERYHQEELKKRQFNRYNNHKFNHNNFGRRND
ncbi:MAG: cytochrome b5 domain-containing protein [Candidatus Falkowbacteria bacterium]